MRTTQEPRSPTYVPADVPTPPFRSTVPQPPKRFLAGATALILIAALIGAGLVAWDRAADDGDQALAEAIAERDDARDRVGVLSTQVEALNAELTEATQQTGVLESDLAAAERQLVAMLGPALPDGEHFGHLVAFGATQSPPRIVVDIEQWFTDQAAVEAAIEDGVTVDPGINGYYIRNESPRWRTLEVDPSAPVTLTTYPFADPSSPTTMTVRGFGELLDSFEGRLLLLSPYWIEVRDGQVVAIQEQFIP